MKGIHTEKLQIGEIDTQTRVPIWTSYEGVAREETSEEAMTNHRLGFEGGIDGGTHFLRYIDKGEEVAG